MVMRPAGRTFWEGEVPFGPGKGNRWLNGKGVVGAGESEGNRRQSAGLGVKESDEAALRVEAANIVKARYLHGKHGRRSDRHQREGEVAIPGEICGSAFARNARMTALCAFAVVRRPSMRWRRRSHISGERTQAAGQSGQKRGGAGRADATSSATGRSGRRQRS